MNIQLDDGVQFGLGAFSWTGIWSGCGILWRFCIFHRK